MVELVRYRAGQFLRALTARVTEEEVAKAIHILTPEAQRLFRRQTVQDQRHALAVYLALREAGHTDRQLLAAALLHDVGKAAAPLSAWQRAAIVLLDRFAPRLLACLSRVEPKGHILSLPKDWRRPFVVYARHPEIGAHWAQEAGCSPLTVALIRRHQEDIKKHPPFTVTEKELLAALQAADGRH